MVQRIFWVALYTGLAQVTSLFAVTYILREVGKEASGYLGIIDSTLMVIMTIISFGLQLSVNRNVAIKTGWRSNYYLGQSARIAVGLLVLLFGIGSILISWDVTKLIFLLAPLVALNGDYALYGNGLPVQASRLSFFRVAIPAVGLFLASLYVPDRVLPIYVSLVAVGVFVAGFGASRLNQVPYLFRPKKSFYKFYLKYYKVGIYQVSSVILITGILTVSKGFYSIATLGLVYGILKYFEVFKGVLRIIVQAFFKELKLDRVNIRIDKVGILIGGFAIIPTLIYPKITLDLLYGDTYDGLESLVMIFGVGMLVASFQASASARALLTYRDNLNLVAYLGALVLALGISMVFSYQSQPIYGIPLAVVAGELFLLIVLGSQLGGISFFKERILFFLKIAPVLIIAVGCRLILYPSLTLLVATCVFYAVWVLFFFRRLIFDKSFLLQKE